MDMDKYIGRLLDGRYEILEAIGTGGMAVVYKARCHRLNRLVAIKILKDELTKDEEFRRRFHAESQAVAMLSHPNIVNVYDVSTTNEADYIVMELIDGISLKQYMEKKGVLNWKETLHFAMQIAKALDHAHSRGIIHRDIKPHNVMVLKNGSVKVADFGIAQVMSKSNTLTKEALGSVHYISPEQAKGGRVDNRSDLYSLGVVMYEMMTGRPPYDGESPVAVAIQHINGKADMPSTLNPNIPGGLEQIIMKAMAQDISQRYISAKEMLQDMDEFRKDPTILFDYHNSSTGMDDATQIKRPAAEPEKTVTTAVKKTVAKTEPSRKPVASPGKNKKKRHKEEIVEEEERGTKAAAIVYSIFAVVALAAIIIFCVALFGDDGVSSNENTISVPSLINKVYEDIVAEDYVLEISRHQYSSEYEKGKVIDQTPSAGERVEKGSTVTVVISEGPKPTEVTMTNLVGVDEEMAINYLKNALGVDQDLILCCYEVSTKEQQGKVIRTDPMEGVEIQEDQTVYLYVGTGPSSKTVTMVDLTSDFYNETSAKNWLDKNGFDDVEIQYVTSSRPAGKVVAQSVASGLTVDVSTHIVLQVSEGSTSETDPTKPVDTPVDNQITKKIQVTLPEDLTEDCTLSISYNGVVVEERKIMEGTIWAEFYLSGNGVQKFWIELDTGIGWWYEVDFRAEE